MRPRSAGFGKTMFIPSLRLKNIAEGFLPMEWNTCAQISFNLSLQRRLMNFRFMTLAVSTLAGPSKAHMISNLRETNKLGQFNTTTRPQRLFQCVMKHLTPIHQWNHPQCTTTKCAKSCPCWERMCCQEMKSQILPCQYTN